MLVGRRTWDVGDKMKAEHPGSTDYPFSGAMFLLSHRPLDPPDPGVSVLSGDIGNAVARRWTPRAARTWKSGRQRCGPVLPAGTRRRGPGLCTAGAARRRRSLLCSGHDTDRAGTAQQQAVRRHDHPPVPCPQVICPTQGMTRGSSPECATQAWASVRECHPSARAAPNSVWARVRRPSAAWVGSLECQRHPVFT